MSVTDHSTSSGVLLAHRTDIESARRVRKPPLNTSISRWIGLIS